MILALALVAASASTQAVFPGRKSICASPDTHHVVRWAEPASGRGQHHLWLRDGRGGGEIQLLAFPRQVEVFWSSSGRQLAVTNRWASDESTVLLWTTLEDAPADLLARLLVEEGQEKLRWNVHHLYLEVTGWQNEDALGIRLWGYGDAPHAIDRSYVYSVRRGFSRE